MAIDLKPFCGTEESRPYLHDPFNRGDHTYATNGHVLIRVAKRGDAAEASQLLPRSFDELIASLQPRWLDAHFAPIPEFTLIHRPEEKCGVCGGSGRCECESCDHEHECGRCDGSGTSSDEWKIARFPDQDLKLGYVELIRSLPGVTIAFGTNDGDPAVFRFEGGVGCIMPMRSRNIPSSKAAEAA